MYRLMIADDQSIECRALEHKIQTEFENIEVLPSARDGIDFLKKAEEFKPDIAIVDINMPGLNGLETIEILKMRNINMKVIIHTSYSEFDYARKAIQLGGRLGCTDIYVQLPQPADRHAPFPERMVHLADY